MLNYVLNHVVSITSSFVFKLVRYSSFEQYSAGKHVI
jgi:hypothetical protein